VTESCGIGVMKSGGVVMGAVGTIIPQTRIVGLRCQGNDDQLETASGMVRGYETRSGG
jgi:hypothetical protein